MYFEGYNYHGTSFEQTYRCYPASFIERPQLEVGDKIIMPPSALDRLASLHIDYPMLFELHNSATNRKSHCGVLEFVAEEGMIYMPYWMMQNMLLQEGDAVRVKNVTLPKGKYVKLQPHTTDFLDISNPKAILETTLRNFSCLTTGDSIMVAYNNKQYYIDIMETKPSSAISIIETDCEVDFAPPLDYKEPERPQQPSVPSNVAPAQVQEAEPEEPKFIPFTGTGKRLDGKPSKNLAAANSLFSTAQLALILTLSLATKVAKLIFTKEKHLKETHNRPMISGKISIPYSSFKKSVFSSSKPDKGGSLEGDLGGLRRRIKRRLRMIWERNRAHFEPTWLRDRMTKLKDAKMENNTSSSLLISTAAITSKMQKLLLEISIVL